MPTWVVTGASRGIGYALIRQLALNHSNTVIALVRNVESTTKTLAADNVGNVHVLEADISRIDSIKKAAEETSKVAPTGVDYLINNAAYLSESTEAGTIGDFPPKLLEQELLESFKVNVVGVVHTINAFMPLIERSAAKKVIVISSGMGDLDFINNAGIVSSAPYSISKGAVNTAVAKFNAAYQKRGILFLAISPGLVDTGKLPAENNDDGPRFMAYAGPDFKGPMTPEESARAVLKVIDQASLEKGDGGAFISHFGNKRWL